VELILQVDRTKVAATAKAVTFKAFEVFKWFSDAEYEAVNEYDRKGLDIERVKWEVTFKAYRKNLGTHIIKDHELDLKEFNESLRDSYENGATNIVVKHQQFFRSVARVDENPHTSDFDQFDGDIFARGSRNDVNPT